MNTKLIALSEKVKRKEKIDNILDELYIKKDETQGRIYDLQAELTDEESDLVRLEGFSLQNMWYTLLGTKDEQIEAEKQDIYNIQLQLAGADNEMKILSGEIAKYEAELETLGDCEDEYEEELERRINSISLSDTLDEDDKVVVVERLGEISANLTEIDQAVNAGNKALGIIEGIKENLSGAQSWAIADMLTDSLLITIAKRNKMDKAQDGIYWLQQALTQFKTEMTDVDVDADISVVMDDFLDIADFWLGGLFIDWMVHDRIKSANDNVAKTESSIQGVLTQLNSLQAELKTEKEKLEKYL